MPKHHYGCKLSKPKARLPKGWVETVIDMRWERTDGALVRYDDRSPYPNPSKESSLMLTAWGPGEEGHYLIRRNKRGIGWCRRWKNPIKAMKAVDLEHPLPNN